MDPKLYHTLSIESDPKTHKKYETVFKNLIYLLFVVLLFGCVVLGLGLVYSNGECNTNEVPINSSSTEKQTVNWTFNSMNPTKLEYIWPENVEGMINDIVDNNMHITNDDRAVLLKTELMRFDTSDVFYIMVYNSVDGPANHAFYGNRSEYITVFKPGKCNVVVYRSHFWRGSPESALTTVTRQIEDTCKKGILSKSNYSDVPKELFNNFHDINFLGIIGEQHNVAVRSANSFGRVWGPGYWDKLQVLDSETKESTGKEFILIAGYK